LAAAAGRGGDDEAPARELAATAGRLPHLAPIAADVSLAWQAADIAAQHRPRGSDAVYAAVARRLGSTLVTLDREQRERVRAVIPARLPAEAWAETASPATPLAQFDSNRPLWYYVPCRRK
jgi:predicted nucleic acid-binding protein